MRVVRKPARPWSSNARSQDRNSSSESWYTRQASSTVIPPLRTATTTAALRRTTHLLVFGCGSCSISRVPPTDSPGGVLIRRRQAALGPAPLHQDPPIIELAGKTAAYSRSPCSTAPFLATRQFPFVSRSFHDRERVVINFSTFRIEFRPASASVLRPDVFLSNGCLYAGPIVQTLCRNVRSDAKMTHSRYFHVCTPNFSRLVLAASANFTLV